MCSGFEAAAKWLLAVLQLLSGELEQSECVITLCVSTKMTVVKQR